MSDSVWDRGTPTRREIKKWGRGGGKGRLFWYRPLLNCYSLCAGTGPRDWQQHLACFRCQNQAVAASEAADVVEVG